MNVLLRSGSYIVVKPSSIGFVTCMNYLNRLYNLLSLFENYSPIHAGNYYVHVSYSMLILNLCAKHYCVVLGQVQALCF